MLKVTKHPLDNTQVRQALAYAVDRQQILDEALFDQGKVPTGPGHPDSAGSPWGCCPRRAPTGARGVSGAGLRAACFGPRASGRRSYSRRHRRTGRASAARCRAPG
ncbi:MAG: hypothetical protein JO023_15885 [Chloroflexi bacterium]|nr:hypothetical protein [Chloroflexota bacterium]